MAVDDNALSEGDLRADPIEQFHLWFADARAANVQAPEAMTLATATLDGRPSARMVLLKGVDGRGFVFYTNYDSRKGSELAENPRAALVFYWPALHRQVRVEGRVERVTPAESEAYFQTRPLGSRVGAHASPQSQVIPNREWLERKVRAVEAAYPEGMVPLPENWGGNRLVPDMIEFWQGRLNRLHDRLRYQRAPEGSWTIERLAP